MMKWNFATIDLYIYFFLHLYQYQARRDDCVQKKRNVPQDIVDEKDESLQVC